MPPSFRIGAGATFAEDRANLAALWRSLRAEAKSLKLPTKFLDQVPPDFVRVDFEDLRTFAAEYHPEEHRMVLDRNLSLNRAGGALRPLRQLASKEIQTLYHELFHAFMDFLATRSLSSENSSLSFSSDSLWAFARGQQHCRYERILITPIPQNKAQTEERFLDESESWEALNETWAVFVGWAVWTQVELQTKRQHSADTKAGFQRWLERLARADNEAELVGYYEPGNQAEKAIARKRVLAPEYRISPPEIAVLMKEVLGYPDASVDRSVALLRTNGRGKPVVECMPHKAS